MVCQQLSLFQSLLAPSHILCRHKQRVALGHASERDDTDSIDRFSQSFRP